MLLCYKFGTEAYVLMKQFTLVVKDVIAVNSNLAIVNSQQLIKFSGSHISNYIRFCAQLALQMW